VSGKTGPEGESAVMMMHTDDMVAILANGAAGGIEIDFHP
jgi:hypothetical protein